MSAHIRNFRDCISDQEVKQRLGVWLVSGIIWLGLLLVIAASLGMALIFILPGLIINWLIAEYQVRKLQALGATVSHQQFPLVYEALEEVAKRFDFPHDHRTVILPSGEVNAFAIKFAKKKVMVILTEALEAVLDCPAQLRALIAHEMCHLALDHGSGSWFTIYKPAKFKAARELSCDNAGLVAAGDLDEAKTLIKKLVAGRRLHKLISEPALVKEGDFLYSGFYGWLLRQYLTHPPAGKRIENLAEFAAENGILSLAATGPPPLVARVK